MKANLLLLLLGFFVTSHAVAIGWEKTEIGQGPNAGDLVATSLDQLGRVHVVFTEETSSLNPDPGTLIRYRIRRAAGRDFESFDTPIFIQTSTVVALTLDVTATQNVQLAVITGRGNVFIYERAENATSWGAPVVLASNGSATPERSGISLRAAGNGNLRSGLVYTSDTGRAFFVEQQADGSWGSPTIAINTAEAGLAVKLINTPMGVSGSSDTRRVVVAYDEIGERIVVARQTVVELNSIPIPLWNTVEEVALAPDLTRPDIAYFRGQLGVTSTRVEAEGRVFYHQLVTDTTGGGASWQTQAVATAAELEDLEFFGNHAALAFDSQGAPLVAYQKQFFAILVVVTNELRTRRLVDGLGWELSVVEQFDNSNNGLQQEVDLTTSLSGDPALLYRRTARTNDADSAVVFARPFAQPWVLDRPEPLENYSRTYTPALCRGLEGKLHMVISGVTGGLFDPLEEAAPRLVTLSGASVSSVEIPSSRNPYSAYAVTATANGIVHCVGLRLVTTDNEVGDLLYQRGQAEGPFATAGLVEEGVNHAKAGTLILKSDDAGTLYCAFLTPDGNNAKIRTLPSGATEWQTLQTLNGSNIVGFDLDVRSDGGWAASWAEEDQIQFRSNVDPRSGALSESLFLLSYDLPIAFTVADSAIAFAGDDRPRITYSTIAGVLNYLTPRQTGGLTGLWTRSDAGLNFNNAIIEMEGRGNLMHIMAHTPADGGTLRHVQVKNDLHFESEGFSVPAVSLTTSADRQSLAGTLDANGFPVMAVGMFKVFSIISSTDQVIFCRPADGMDRDADGIPFLLEEAHCLNDRFPNSRIDLARPRVRKTGENINLSFEFRRPFGVARNLASGRSYGDFSYTYETSTNLKNWTEEVMRDGVLPLIDADLETDEGLNCRRSLQGFFYFGEAVTADAQRFNRLMISRVR